MRTAGALAVLTGTPIHLRQVRAGRSRPGLAPQHVTSLRALAQISGGKLHGDHCGSTSVQLVPRHVPQGGTVTMDVREAAPNGSAGSMPLVFKALCWPLVMAQEPSRLVLRGGTHVAWSPTYQYVRDVFLSTTAPMGGRFRCSLEQYGFYPAGQGEMHVEIMPATAPLAPQTMLQRGELERIEGTAAATQLPKHIPQRMKSRAEDRLTSLSVPVDIDATTSSGAGPGAGIVLTAVYKYARAGFTGLGEPGKPAETVADDAVDALHAHHTHGAPVDSYLADQLLLPMALADGRSRFRATRLTSHVRTQAALIQEMVDVSIELDAAESVTNLVSVNGCGLSPS